MNFIPINWIIRWNCFNHRNILARNMWSAAFFRYEIPTQIKLFVVFYQENRLFFTIAALYDWKFLFFVFWLAVFATLKPAHFSFGRWSCFKNLVDRKNQNWMPQKTYSDRQCATCDQVFVLLPVYIPTGTTAQYLDQLTGTKLKNKRIFGNNLKRLGNKQISSSNLKNKQNVSSTHGFAQIVFFSSTLNLLGLFLMNTLGRMIQIFPTRFFSHRSIPWKQMMTSSPLKIINCRILQMLTIRLIQKLTMNFANSWRKKNPYLTSNLAVKQSKSSGKCSQFTRQKHRP